MTAANDAAIAANILVRAMTNHTLKIPVRLQGSLNEHAEKAAR